MHEDIIAFLGMIHDSLDWN